MSVNYTLQQHEIDFAAELKKELGDDKVTSQLADRMVYANDASVTMIPPVAILTPKNTDDIATAIKLANKYNVPLVARGSGTSLAGQTVNRGLVIDFKPHFNKIGEFERDENNPKQGFVWTGPGVVHQDLTRALVFEDAQFEFASLPATAKVARMGGVLGNGSSGTMSIKFGTSVRYLEATVIMLADGRKAYLGTKSDMQKVASDDSDLELQQAAKVGLELYAKVVDDLVENNKELIDNEFPKVIRRVGGYSLDALVRLKDGEEPNLAKIMVGAEGTLAIMLAAKVRVLKKPDHVVRLVGHFESQDAAFRSVPKIVAHHNEGDLEGLATVEYMNGPLVDLCLNNETTSDKMGWLSKQRPVGGVLSIEVIGDDEEKCNAEASEVLKTLQQASPDTEHAILNKEDGDNMFAARAGSLGIAINADNGGKGSPISVLEDACVPVEHLADYAALIENECKELGFPMIAYGHASVGVIHFTPVVDLSQEDQREKVKILCQKAVKWCKEFGGSWSGEHGDGVVRGWQNDVFWSAEMLDVFRALKEIFDPKGLMNPGKIVDTPDLMDHLREHTMGRPKQPIKLFYKYPRGGPIEAAVGCQSAGVCLNTFDPEAMCPTLLTTKDERLSPRGRARAISQWQHSTGTLDEEGYNRVMGNCLGCDHCVRCPASVPIPNYKVDLKGHLRKSGKLGRDNTIPDILFGEAAAIASLTAGKPFLTAAANAMIKMPFVREQLDKLGISSEPILPTYARKTFMQWHKKHRRRTFINDDLKAVTLFVDPFTNTMRPDIAMDAIALLEYHGYPYTIVCANDCRALISRGFLDKAKRIGDETIRTLDAHARANSSILLLEPSAQSALTKELPKLIDDTVAANRVVEKVFAFQDFLADEFSKGKIKIDINPANLEKESVLVHGHCHEKAHKFGLQGTVQILSHFVNVVTTQALCCGMAGSFSLDKKTRPLGLKVFERQLGPEVDTKMTEDRYFVAAGLSCTHQVEDLRNVEAIHPVRMIAAGEIGRLYLNNFYR